MFVSVSQPDRQLPRWLKCTAYVYGVVPNVRSTVLFPLRSHRSRLYGLQNWKIGSELACGALAVVTAALAGPAP